MMVQTYTSCVCVCLFLGSQNYEFEFEPDERPYESYNGINVRCRYFIEVVIERSYLANISNTQDIVVQKPSEEPQENGTIQMEVGIEECLHIEFEYAKEQ